MRAAVLVGALAIGGCGSAGETPQSIVTPSPPAAVASPPATAAPVSRQTGQVGTLHADVSPLSGTVTGFAVRTTDLATIVMLDADILFDFDKATLRPDAEAQLGKTADLIRQGGAGAIAIDGFTDAKGSDAYNLDLSRRRAETVADWMRRQVGVRQRTFTVTGKGEAEPVAPNTQPDGSDDPAGRAKNRRVQIVIPRG